jgi:hypothetical protein
MEASRASNANDVASGCGATGVREEVDRRRQWETLLDFTASLQDDAPRVAEGLCARATLSTQRQTGRTWRSLTNERVLWPANSSLGRGSTSLGRGKGLDQNHEEDTSIDARAGRGVRVQRDCRNGGVR